jgi:hypothetical protein
MASKSVVAVGVKIGRGARVSELGGNADFGVEIGWHVRPAGSTDYSTLCGIDADDPTLGTHGAVEASPGKR